MRYCSTDNIWTFTRHDIACIASAFTHDLYSPLTYELNGNERPVDAQLYGDLTNTLWQVTDPRLPLHTEVSKTLAFTAYDLYRIFEEPQYADLDDLLVTPHPLSDGLPAEN